MVNEPMMRKIIPGVVKDQTISALTATASVADAAKVMKDSNIAAVVISDDSGKLIGIVTERDMTRRVIAEGLDAKKTQLGDVMTKDPDTLAPDDTAGNALELMRTRGYRHLPVTVDGKAVGMVSVRDLYEIIRQDLEKHVRETEAFVFGDRYGA